MPVASDELIRSHYRQVAQKHGASPRSTMEDDFVREKELECIRAYRALLHARRPEPLQILDLGCGNGYALSRLSAASPADHLWGMDFSDDLIGIALQRNLPDCTFIQGDARRLPFDEGAFDFVYTERCLINILDPIEQLVALREIARILKPGADYLMIESFTDGLENNNKARADCGLPPVEQAYHNRYFEKDTFFPAVRGMFAVVDEAEFGNGASPCSNFLSSYYFISRVLYPAMLHGGEFVRNSEVAKFFSFLPPVGNYSPIQAFVLRTV